MNQRQRTRKHARRVAHPGSTGQVPTLRRSTFETVKKGHIIPAVYQRNFAVTEQVAVHAVGQTGCQIRNVKTAGTRRRFYRRTRPEGESIDDIEASLSALESSSRDPLVAVGRGDRLTQERKGVLGQFLGMQMVRGPAFFTQRAALLTPVIEQLQATDFKPEAVAEAGGDIEHLRSRLLESQLSSTERFSRMLGLGLKMGAVLGSMRWHILEFDAPLLAYSDHPVVVWPAGVAIAEPSATPGLAPLDAFEVRVPLSPEVAVLMTWADVPDEEVPVPVDHRFASELNAFVIAQADEEWMHRPGPEPPLVEGPCELGAAACTGPTADA